MANDGLVQRVWRTVRFGITIASLSTLACTIASSSRGQGFFLDLSMAVEGYMMDGSPLRGTMACPVRALDATALGLLQNEFGDAMRMTLRGWGAQVTASFPLVSEVFNDIRLAPNGDWVAFAGEASWSANGCEAGIGVAAKSARKWMIAWCSATLEGIPKTVSWSRDSSRVAFSSAGVVLIVNVVDHGVTILGNGTSPRWSPTDDRIAYFEGGDLVICKIELTTAKGVHQTVERHGLPVNSILPSALEWSVGGEYLIVRNRLWLPASDSRVRVAVGLIDAKLWKYHETSIRLWGETSTLRWVDPSSGGDFKNLVKIRAEACKNDPRMGNQ